MERIKKLDNILKKLDYKAISDVTGITVFDLVKEAENALYSIYNNHPRTKDVVNNDSETINFIHGRFEVTVYLNSGEYSYEIKYILTKAY